MVTDILLDNIAQNIITAFLMLFNLAPSEGDSTEVKNEGPYRVYSTQVKIPSGAAIDMDIATSYLHFGTPSQLHRITKWRPEFVISTGSASSFVRCGYALDFSDKVHYAFTIGLNSNTVWNDHSEWEDIVAFDGVKPTPTKLTTIPKVYDQFRRCQIRYQNHAAFTPVSFKSHTLTVQTQRIR